MMGIGLVLKLIPFVSGASFAVSYPEESTQAIGIIKSGLMTALNYVAPLFQEVPV